MLLHVLLSFIKQRIRSFLMQVLANYLFICVFENSLRYEDHANALSIFTKKALSYGYKKSQYKR